MAVRFCSGAQRNNTRQQCRTLLLLLLIATTDALIGTDGVCKVFTFVPFTTNFGYTDAIGLGEDRKNIGFSHMAAALLAAQHFNSRNASVIPELVDLNGCNITLDVTSFFDTGSLTQRASQELAQQNEIPCAIAGPFNDYPAGELNVMAQAFKFPIVVHRSYNPRQVSNFFFNYTTQVYPDLVSSTKTLVSFLLEKKRNNYVALLYSLSDVNFARRESLIFELDANKVEWMTSTYISPFATGSYTYDEIRSPFAALKQIKESGYRTIVVAMDSSGVLPIQTQSGEQQGELQAIADAAESLKMNQGDYFWIWHDVFDPSIAYIDTNVTNIVSGSAWILPLERNMIEGDSFGWRAQGKAEVDSLNSVNPIEEGQVGYRFADDSFFQENEPVYGSGFMYDAVMSIGIGACSAEWGQDGNISGKDHVRGIRRANFNGTTGPVKFGSDTGDDDRAGARLASTVSWVAVNWLPPDMNVPDNMNVSDILFHEYSDKWMPELPFIFRDGSTVPPELRDQPEQNYLSSGLRAMGLAFMSIVIFAAIVSAVWVFFCRKHRVVKASQPMFLYLVCFGAVVQASTVLTMSFDESYGKSEEQLGKACMAMPWLVSLGHIIIYSSLFTKMWRVHKVLQFSRRRVKMQHVLWPMVGFVLCDLILLICWTTLDPLVWERVEINSVTGESIGECVSDSIVAFYVVMVVLMIVPMVITGFFAWKTKDVDEAFTESKWVFFMILWQIEVLFIGVPIAILLRDVSTNGKYVGFAFIILSFPTSTIGFIMLPKFLAYLRDVRGYVGRPKRGERVHGRVTGVGSNLHTEGVGSATDNETKSDVVAKGGNEQSTVVATGGKT